MFSFLKRDRPFVRDQEEEVSAGPLSRCKDIVEITPEQYEERLRKGYGLSRRERRELKREIAIQKSVKENEKRIAEIRREEAELRAERERKKREPLPLPGFESISGVIWDPYSRSAFGWACPCGNRHADYGYTGWDRVRCNRCGREALSFLWGQSGPSV